MKEPPSGKSRVRVGNYLGFALLAVVTVTVYYLLSTGRMSLLTPDQQAYRNFERKEYVEAAERFADPIWRGVSLFRNGDFKEAEGIFAGFDTPLAALNHGNALVMQGKYEEATARYERALQLKPDWNDATVNLEIARGRALMLEKKGGDMTGGELSADDFIFEKGKSSPEAGEEQMEGGKPLSDAAIRAAWLRRVQTRPADFLKAKFAYQYAKEGAVE